MNLKKEIQLAFDEVRKFHPEVCIVVFASDGRWQYMDDNFKGPKFSKEINVSILEKASNSVNDGKPHVFEFGY
jgi:hypothetical protein